MPCEMCGERSQGRLCATCESIEAMEKHSEATRNEPSTDGGVDRAALVLTWVDDWTDPDPDGSQDASSNIWTSRTRIKGEASKSDHVERGEVNEIVDQLIVDGQLVSWHGLIAPARDEHLQAIIQNERLADISRKLLVAKVNKIRRGERSSDPAADALEVGA